MSFTIPRAGDGQPSPTVVRRLSDGEWIVRTDPDFVAWEAAGNVAAVEPLPPAALRALSPRQLRLGLLGAGITRAMVEGAIAAIPDAGQRERAEIEWEYAITYERADALVNQIGGALSLTPEQIDAAWLAAQDL